MPNLYNISSLQSQSLAAQVTAHFAGATDTVRNTLATALATFEAEEAFKGT
jgi:hypothetical protein